MSNAEPRGVDYRTPLSADTIYQLINSSIQTGKPLWLPHANLREADLRKADMRSANLIGSDLHGAHLGGANLRSANLSEANLRSTYIGGGDLSQTILFGSDLTMSYLGEANLNGADLTLANLQYANLSSADLRTVRLQSDFRDKSGRHTNTGLLRSGNGMNITDVEFNLSTKWPEEFDQEELPEPGRTSAARRALGFLGHDRFMLFLEALLTSRSHPNYGGAFLDNLNNGECTVEQLFFENDKYLADMQKRIYKKRRSSTDVSDAPGIARAPLDYGWELNIQVMGFGAFRIGFGWRIGPLAGAGNVFRVRFKSDGSIAELDEIGRWFS